MRRGALTTVLAYGVAIVVAVAGAAYYLHDRHHRAAATSTSTSALPALVGADFPVELSVYRNARSAVQGHTVLMGVQSSAPAGATTVELWDGPHRIDAHAPGENGGWSFQWPAMAVGPHLVYARVIAKNGRTATSRTYPIDVLALAVRPKGRTGPSAVSVPVPVLPAENAIAVAARLGVPSGDVHVDSRALTATVTLPPTPDPLEANDVLISPAVTPVGGAPGVTLRPSGCGVQATVQGANGVVHLAEAGAGSPGFVEAGSRSRDGVIAVPNMLPGLHMLTVQSGSTRSAPVTFTVPQSCASKLGWSGNTSLIDTALTLPKPINHGYVYLGVDGKPFVRVPSAPSQFLSSTSRRVSLADLMPSLDGHKLVVQAWNQDGANANEVGAGLFLATVNVSVGTMIGEPSSLTLTGTDPHNGLGTSVTMADDGTVAFSWHDSSVQVTGVQWQVLAEPLTTGNHDLAPVGMIASGTSAAGSTVGSPGVDVGVDAVGGTFQVDTAQLSRPPVNTTDPVAVLIGVLGPVTLYVRVIALAPGSSGTTVPLGDASNTVSLTVPGPQHVSPDRFKLDALLVLPGHAPNFDLADCIDVKGTHWQDFPKGLDQPFTEAFYPHDGRYCWEQFDHSNGCNVLCSIGDVLTSIADGLSQLWDFIADAYNGIINTVVDFVAKYNPICAALSAASSGAGSTCEAVGKVVARAAVSAVLESFGLPPSLPTSSTLKAIATGDVTAIGEQLLNELGVPCDDLQLDPSESAAVAGVAGQVGVNVATTTTGTIDACAIAISAVISQVKDQVAAQASNEIADEVGLPECQPGECTITLDPGGHTQPLVVNLIAHRVQGPAQPVIAHVNVTLLGKSADMPSPFQGGSAVVSTVPGNPNEIIAFLSFDNPTPGFNANGVSPGWVVSAQIPKDVLGHAVVESDGAQYFGSYGPQAH